MKRTRLIAFLALVVLQVLVVGNMARGRQVILDSGARVTLGTRPIDPRDLFRGDYVVLEYEISRIDLNEVSWNAPYAEAGQNVWVVLNAAERLARPVAVLDVHPASDEVAIRGSVMWASGDSVAIGYGIREYFVPEGTGWEVERAQEVDVVVAIADDGTAVIDYLILDGVRWQSPNG
jgi:uncharacterized membrane-anchored protein